MNKKAEKYRSDLYVFRKIRDLKQMMNSSAQLYGDKTAYMVKDRPGGPYIPISYNQLKRDVEGWKKTKADDVSSMQTGIMGYKGHIHYHCAPCIDDWLDTLDPEMPKGDLFEAVARHIDTQIHLGYRLYPGNYVAADLLNGDDALAGHYTPEDKAAFEAYLSGQMAKIEMPGKDDNYLRVQMLRMYANPAINHMAAKKNAK